MQWTQTIKDDLNYKTSEMYLYKSVKLTKRLKEKRLRKWLFVAVKLFQGVTTRSEKKYFRILIRQWSRYSLYAWPLLLAECKELVKVNILFAAL